MGGDVSWQDRFRELGEELTSGRITTAEYRRRSADILAEADREAGGQADGEAAGEATGEIVEETVEETAGETGPESGHEAGEANRPRERVRIPRSAAWEAPSGEMTQLVGARDDTTLVRLVPEDTPENSRDEADKRED